MRRRYLIAADMGFVILPSADVRHGKLASRMPGLCLSRLADDMWWSQAEPGLQAETVGDPTRRDGTCYRAANWGLSSRIVS